MIRRGGDCAAAVINTKNTKDTKIIFSKNQNVFVPFVFFVLASSFMIVSPVAIGKTVLQSGPSRRRREFPAATSSSEPLNRTARGRTHRTAPMPATRCDDRHPPTAGRDAARRCR